YVHKRPTENGWPRRDLSQECLSLQRLLDRADAEGAWTGRPKVWTLSFLQESGCHILPGIQIQMEFSVGFGPHWHRIVFGTPEEAAAELAKIDVNYFYVNLGDFDIMQPAKISTSIFGCLAYSPLFQPDSLKSRFRIAWREGDAVLLTLAGGSET